MKKEKVFQLMHKVMKLKNYSINTMKNYLSHVRNLINYYERDVDDISHDDITDYLLYLLEERCCSASYVNQAISAIQLLYVDVLGRASVAVSLPRPKKEKKLPEILSRNEVLRILDNVYNLKHKSMLTLAYSAGLRVGEVASMRIKDIDSKRMLIHIEQGKGKKDRYTLLSKTTLLLLREYVKMYRPREWLFEGQLPDRHITERSIQKVFEQACKRAGVKKDVSIHVLRHSFATHLLEGGTDIRFIQQLLGHCDCKTTQIYTHVTTKNLGNILSPLDRVDMERSG